MKRLAGSKSAISFAVLIGIAANADAQAPAPGGPPAGAVRMEPIPVDQAPGTTLSKQSLSAKGAQSMIDAIVADAIAKHQAVSIAIVDDGGNLLAFKRMDGTSLGTIQAAMTKAVSALKLEASTGAFSQNTNMAMGFMSAGFTVLGGGEPIRAGNTVVGAIAVSGGDDNASTKVGLAAFKP